MKQIKKLDTGNGSMVSIYGGRLQEFKYRNDWDENACNTYVTHYGRKYFLDEFMNAHNNVWHSGNPWKELGFDGYISDSFHSGILIKFEDDESARVYTYIATD